MMFINFTDIYGAQQDPESGELYQVLIQADCPVPVDINLNEVLTISPALTNKGKLYKHLTKLTDRYGNTYRVYGNYKKIIKMKEEGEPTNKIGY